MRPGDGAVRVVAVRVDATADRAARTAAGRDALRALAAELVGADPADVTVRARCATCGGPHGRPVLGGSRALDALHASVAHAGDAVVVAVSGRGPIGIDAEPRGREAPPGTTLAQWVRIEAVLKADGRGLLVDPALVRFEAEATRVTAWIDGEEARYRVRDLELGADRVAALAQHDAGDPERRAPTAVRRPGV
ncbi:4-phosphopantetheinyl transferase [Clavibacter michiganensis]|uniref:4'-phosphopantetheinyl transferase family protein n=1 Tax=Clavibacter michiganensis TaxID=28447 RepID=UPI000CE74E2A|nr:4-phosphopantetheinyl transferase [Clavibacter michiganensis]PPF54294.1 4-phosphopantetheinyl transferase [Clavibacter michiganensis]